MVLLVFCWLIYSGNGLLYWADYWTGRVRNKEKVTGLRSLNKGIQKNCHDRTAVAFNAPDERLLLWCLYPTLTHVFNTPPLCPSRRSGCISTPWRRASLTAWTWLPSASSPSTPSSTPGFSSSCLPACCTFVGPRSAGPPWRPPGVLCSNRRWPKGTLRLTWNCLSRSTRNISTACKLYDRDGI